MAIMAGMDTRRGRVRRWVEEYIESPGGECCTIWPWARFRDGRAAMFDPEVGNTIAAARVVWKMATRKSIPDALEVRHLCGQGHLGCVNPLHLTIGTRSENVMDRVEHGAGNRGERHSMAKLTEDIVREIKSRVASGERKVDVARSLNLSQQQVGRIANGHRWGHVTIERG